MHILQSPEPMRLVTGHNFLITPVLDECDVPITPLARTDTRHCIEQSERERERERLGAKKAGRRQ